MAPTGKTMAAAGSRTAAAAGKNAAAGKSAAAAFHHSCVVIFVSVLHTHIYYRTSAI